MLINFPAMHSELIPEGAEEGVLLFDPGLAADEDGRFRPESLPIDKRTAMALLRDSISFGEQFKDPAEMAFFGAHTPEDYFEESTGTIKNQLLASIGAGKAPGGKVDPEAPSRRAQFVLLLAWATEEGIVESLGLEQGVQASWGRMSEALGIEGDDRESEIGRIVSSTNATSPEGIRIAWPRVLEGMAAFMPEEAALFCSDKDIIEAWEDAGFEFAPANSEYPAGTQTVSAPAWRLSGRSACPEELPFTDREITVVCRK